VTTELMIRYVENRPFDPFEIITVDGRKILVPHSDFATLETYGAAVTIFDESGRVESFDTALIVSLRTLHPLT